jgi:curved DNA-binding protein CbpA
LKDYYKILEINRNSSDEEIKKAYRKLALKYHPDVNNDRNAAAIFKELNEAYRTLGNANKKRHYDFYYVAGSSIKLDDKYRQDKGRKYGTAYRSQHANQRSQSRNTNINKEAKPDFTKLENWMFGSLLIIGLSAMILSVRDIMKNEIKELNDLTGIIFGLLFTFLLIYSWTQIYRKKNP